MERKFIRILSGLLVCALLTACGSGADGQNETSADTSPDVSEEITEEVITAEKRLGKRDYGGAVYTILGREYAKLGNLPSIEFAVDEEDGDLINDTVYKRNRAVEELLNVKIVALQAPSGQSPSLVEASQMAGDGAYNLVYQHVNEMSMLFQKGLLSDFNSMPDIDITQPWWNQLATESLTVNGRCYLQMNYIPFTGVLLSHCLYFNKAVAEDNQIDDLYSLVRENKWDFDTFAKIVKQVSYDLNGDGEYDENDGFGLLCSHGTSGAAFSVAMGTKALKIGSDGGFELTIDSERNQSILEKIVSLTSDKSVYLITDYSKENELAKMFAAGKSLFYSGFLTDSYQFFRDMEDDFGLLPFPKYDSSDENYITTVTGGTGLLGIPKYVEDREMTGAVTEALAIESLNRVYPAIYETVFETKLLRDEDSLEMFDLIMNGLEIDFGRTFKYAEYTDIMCDLVAAGDTSLASSAAKYVNAARNHYEKIIGLYYETEE